MKRREILATSAALAIAAWDGTGQSGYRVAAAGRSAQPGRNTNGRGQDDPGAQRQIQGVDEDLAVIAALPHLAESWRNHARRRLATRRGLDTAFGRRVDLPSRFRKGLNGSRFQPEPLAEGGALLFHQMFSGIFLSVSRSALTSRFNRMMSATASPERSSKVSVRHFDC